MEPFNQSSGFRMFMQNFPSRTTQDETTSTRIINGGGKNPDFNENLVVKVSQLDAVLKCEIWMLSRARNYMEDQLLGFALVPISQIVGKGKVTQNYNLSSTDLFHSPAGTVKLTLSLSANSFPESSNNKSISSEVVLLDRKISEVLLDPVEYSRIEFPDISVVRENQQMVSEYFNGLNSGPNPGGIASFLHLADSVEKKSRLRGESSISLNASITNETNQSSGASPETPTSKKGSEVKDEKVSNFSSKEKEKNQEENNINSAKFGQVFSAPLGNINLEAEQSAMQQQIVDMYMRSMQQFTESLAKMKLPMDLDKPEISENRSEVIQNHNNKLEIEKKKDGSRVFYGSRAFF
ncbi:hypothetical protein Patl1_29385 [Pistacia atlantica]|uniref:Uncharacterized protein n=1 Tax=Pistacia atlantica TaxID=434234 RepID=A0ACC1AA68_9ROSI|nr:hypothetical protein Patl1_29385 [Pistacia atlantica]